MSSDLTYNPKTGEIETDTDDNFTVMAEVRNWGAPTRAWNKDTVVKFLPDKKISFNGATHDILTWTAQMSAARSGVQFKGTSKDNRIDIVMKDPEGISAQLAPNMVEIGKSFGFAFKNQHDYNKVLRYLRNQNFTYTNSRNEVLPMPFNESRITDFNRNTAGYTDFETYVKKQTSMRGGKRTRKSKKGKGTKKRKKKSQKKNKKSKRRKLSRRRNC
jgi:hypothetical protein